MSLIEILLILIVLGALCGIGPWWGYSAGWGTYPVGGVGVLLIILIVVLIVRRRD